VYVCKALNPPIGEAIQSELFIDPEHIFQVLVPDHNHNRETGLLCRCPVLGTVIPVDYNPKSPGRLNDAWEIASMEAPGVAFLFENAAILDQIQNGTISDLWVVLRGDFVKDLNNWTIDAEFVRAELPTGDRPSGSPFGVQGGLFESWFWIGRRPLR
jgi:hypothetical protein